MKNLKLHKDIPLVGKHRRPIVTDFYFLEGETPKPVIIFLHGYKGYKDWGAWNIMLSEFAKAGYFVVAFNFSHNGGTIEQPIDFPDLESFGNDNFSIQQGDLQSVIDEVTSSEFKFSANVNPFKVTLIGHSRGGGASILKASNEPKITRLITLASISTYDTSFLQGEALENWKKEGVWYITNGRTQQQMPHYIQFYEDYEVNKADLNIESAAKKLNIPHLIVHGTKDTSVTIENAQLIQSWHPNAELFTLETDHVFGTKQPWESATMSEDLAIVTQKCISFLNSTR